MLTCAVCVVDLTIICWQTDSYFKATCSVSWSVHHIATKDMLFLLLY